MDDVLNIDVSSLIIQTHSGRLTRKFTHQFPPQLFVSYEYALVYNK
jgi:hypothetical protein